MIHELGDHPEIRWAENLPHDEDEPSAPEQRFQDGLQEAFIRNEGRRDGALFGEVVVLASALVAEKHNQILRQGLDCEVTVDRRGNGFSGRVRLTESGNLVVEPRRP